MNDLQERAENYAAEKMNELMAKAIAQAYADGYRDGYKKCAEDYEIDLYEDVEFVDLGLPSGLLWSSKYRKDDEGAPLYLTYEEAAALDIPTEEQFSELIKCCEWKHLMGYINYETDSLELIPLVSDARYENAVLPIKMRDIYSLEMV